MVIRQNDISNSFFSFGFNAWLIITLVGKNDLHIRVL